ncbi:hypothetical protein B7494_g7902 [Chlorociboria aeruginascens]|nr:hypothetical protein B7494_g7902 [Chlorociboria aeruginascens]
MPDSGAAGISFVGESQFLAFQKEYPHIKLNVSSSGANKIKFGKGIAIAKGTVRVPTPLGEITFHVVPTNTPFLICLQDMNALGMHGKSPGRFKFTLKNDIDFNHSIIIDIFYLDGAPVLHVVDSATGFGAARFLNNISIYITWKVLRACWIDMYLGPPDQVVHDAGKNFASTKFKQYAKSMAIDVKEVPVEAHNSVGLVKRYYAPLRRAYQTISNELAGESVSKDAILQIAVKAVNDTAGPEGLVPTLLIFGAYPRMAESDPPFVGIVKRAKAIKSAIKKLRRLQAER